MTDMTSIKNSIGNLTKALAGLRSRSQKNHEDLVNKAGTPEAAILATEANNLETQIIATEAALEAAGLVLKTETERQRSPEYKANLKAMDDLKADSDRKIAAIRAGAEALVKLGAELKTVQDQYKVKAKAVGAGIYTSIDQKNEARRAIDLVDKIANCLDAWRGYDINKALKGKIATPVYDRKPTGVKAKMLDDRYHEPRG